MSVILAIILISKQRKRDRTLKDLEEKNKGNIEIADHQPQPQFVIDGANDEVPATRDLAKIQEKLVKERTSESLSDAKKANLKRNSKLGRKKSIIGALG